MSNHNEIDESLRMQQSKISQKLERLTDAFIENVIDKNQFEDKKEKLLVELQGFKRKSLYLSDQKEAIFKKASKFLDLQIVAFPQQGHCYRSTLIHVLRFRAN